MQDLHGAYALWRFLHSKHMTAAYLSHIHTTKHLNTSNPHRCSKCNICHHIHCCSAIDSRSTAPDTWEEAAMQANAAAQWHRKCFAKQLH